NPPYALLATIPVGTDPQQLVISPDGTRAYVTASFSEDVTVLDITNPANPVIDDIIPVGVSPVGVAISRSGTRVYAANGGSNTVSVINTATNAVINSVAVGAAPLGVAVGQLAQEGSLVPGQTRPGKRRYDQDRRNVSNAPQSSGSRAEHSRRSNQSSAAHSSTHVDIKIEYSD
ncbi:YncE family protein, partial [Nonomuraea basaltis]|uniref:YncE family protein n=1 Tax=Nonomuraea basaltis TaxID=2495887 RepID=UPI003B847DE9